MNSFTVVAECNGFAAAARQLHLSTPVLTKQMQRLESILGKKLFDRTTRRISLTEAGMTYFAHVKNILNEIQNARNAVHDLEQAPHGNLNIGVPGAVNSKFFIKVVQTFINKYPKISFFTTDENSPASLLNGSLDLVISEANFQDKRFSRDYLLTVRRGIFASPKYIKKYGVPKNIADLKNHNCLIYTPLSPNNEWIFANNKKIKVNGNYSSNSGMNIVNAALAGIGLISCPDLVIKAEIESKKLVEIELEKEPVKTKVYIYYLPVHYSSNVRLLIDHLKQSAVTL